MRNCQICGEPDRKLLFSGYDGQDMSLFECDGCGHRYVDSAQLSQAWFDKYYTTQYTTSDTPYSFERYAALADFVASRAKDILDIGGLNGELHEHFGGLPVKYEAIGVGDGIARKYECVVMSHTLEHIYDIEAIMKVVKNALDKGGLFVVEVPVHITYKEPKEYDYHWQHINKFRPMDLMELLIAYGFNVVEFCQLSDYREYQCWRIAGRI